MNQYYGFLEKSEFVDPEFIACKTSSELCEWVETLLNNGIKKGDIHIIEGHDIPFNISIKLDPLQRILSPGSKTPTEEAKIEPTINHPQTVEESDTEPGETHAQRKKRGPYKKRKQVKKEDQQAKLSGDYHLPCMTCRNSHKDANGNYPPCKNAKFTKTETGLEFCSIWWDKDEVRHA